MSVTFSCFHSSQILGESGQLCVQLLLLEFPISNQERWRPRASCSNSGLRGACQAQGSQHGGDVFSALCLDSDKGIFKFIEITAEASQFYFRPRIHHLFPWSYTRQLHELSRAGTRLGVRAGGYLGAWGQQVWSSLSEAKT